MTDPTRIGDVLPDAARALGIPIDARTGRPANPADPDLFRTDYRRQRWYVDPLPGCELAPQAGKKDRWPAVSTIKRAWSKEFSKRWPDGIEGAEVYPLDPLRVALYADANWDHLTTLPTDQRVPALAKAAKAALDAAASRGTGVHNGLEHLDNGDEVAARLAAGEWWPVVEVIHETKPAGVPVHTEVVGINRTLGFAGTLDGLHRLPDGRLVVIDWKTRGGEHDAYPEEACQLGFYSLCEYLIIADGATAKRVPLPVLDGGLIISITQGGYAVYPVDLGPAQDAARDLLECWHKKKTGQAAGRKAIGTPLVRDLTEYLAAEEPPAEWTPTDVAFDGTLSMESVVGVPEPPDATPADPERVTWIRQRITTMSSSPGRAAFAAAWPEGVPTPKNMPEGGWTDADIDRLAEALSAVEAEHSMPFPDEDPVKTAARAAEVAAEWSTEKSPAPSVAPVRDLDEGEVMSDEDVAAVRSAAKTLADEHRHTLVGWSKDGERDGRPWAGNVLTRRTWEIGRAAIACARHLHDPDGDGLTRAALAIVIGEDLQATWRTGAVLGSLSIEEAQRLHDVAEAFGRDDDAVVTDLGTRLAATA